MLSSAMCLEWLSGSGLMLSSPSLNQIPLHRTAAPKIVIMISVHYTTVEKTSALTEAW